MTGRGRVCFFSEFAYPVLTAADGFAGGAEVMVALMARGLTRLGFDVHIATMDFGQPEPVRIEGITLHRAYRHGAGLPILRFFHPRLTLGVRSLARADAEVYYVIGSGMPAGLTHDVARLRRAGFVLHAMNDLDVTRDLAHWGYRDRSWYRRALHDADVLFAQTDYQRGMFRSEHGVESAVLPNIVSIPDAPIDAGQDGHVMWVGTYKALKRPEWFVALARELPQRRFVMAGVVPPAPFTTEHYDAARAAARECPNLRVLGFQPESELRRLMSEASLIVHTSPREGFSNVMLEAWGMGIPTVSSVNPDTLVTRLGLGEVVEEYPALVGSVSRLMEDAAARREAGQRARRYVTERHGEAVVLDQMARALDGVVAQVRHRRGRSRGPSA